MWNTFIARLLVSLLALLSCCYAFAACTYLLLKCTCSQTPDGFRRFLTRNYRFFDRTVNYVEPDNASHNPNWAIITRNWPFLLPPIYILTVTETWRDLPICLAASLWVGAQIGCTWYASLCMRRPGTTVFGPLDHGDRGRV
jgi:hypothetical protein